MFLTGFYFLIFFLSFRKSDSENEGKKEPDAELIAAKQRETLPLEERVEMFKGLLAEKEVILYFIYLHLFYSSFLFIFTFDRSVHFQLGRKSFIKLSLIHGIYYLHQKNVK